MKKSFLIFGALAALFATNGYAAQSGTLKIECTCPDGCHCLSDSYPNGQSTFYCTCWPEQNPAPTPGINILDMIANQNSDTGIVQHTGVVQQNTIKQEKQNKVSARARVAGMPKTTKKIVYEEIVEDDEAE